MKIYKHTRSNDTACTLVELNKVPRLNRNGRSVKLCQHGVCSLNANFDLHWTIGVCTATHLQIPPSSPSHPIIGHLQRFRIVPAKPLWNNVVSLWSYLIPLSRSLPGIISDR